MNHRFLTICRLPRLALVAASAGAALAGSHARAQQCNVGDDFMVVHPLYVVWYADANPAAFGWENNGWQLGLDSDRPNFCAGEPNQDWANGRDDFFVFRAGRWYGRSNLATTQMGDILEVGNFGLAGDLAVIGNFTNSGDQIGVVGRRAGSDDIFFISDSNRNLQYELSDRQYRWNVGLATGDRVIPGYFGDTNGEDLAVYRTATQTWELYLQMPFEGPAGTPFATVRFGVAGEIPLSCDVNGDGHSDILMWNPTSSRLFINLWEQGAPNSGYGPDFDQDDWRDYSPEVTYINTLYNTPGLRWDTAVGGLNFDSIQQRNPPVPFAVTWDDGRLLCPNSGGTIRLTAHNTAAYRCLWTIGSCSGPVVGEGATVVLPAPSQTTTYYAHTENYGWCARPSACNSVTIVLSGPPSVTQHPQPASCCRDESACFEVTASGAGTLSYQWYRDGVPISDGPTGCGSTLSGTGTRRFCINRVCAQDADRQYSCRIDNNCGGVMSSPATLTLLADVIVTQHPISQWTCVGRTAYLSTEGVGAGPISYLWLRDGVPLADGPTGYGSSIHGAGTPVMSVVNVQGPDLNRSYNCRITGRCNTVATENATLRVCSVDINCDGVGDFFDYLDFAQCFAFGQSCADFNGSGQVDFFDYLDFVGELEHGCR